MVGGFGIWNGSITTDKITFTDSCGTNSDAWMLSGNSIIRESEQDPRSEARRWLDERVEEVRVLAWH